MENEHGEYLLLKFVADKNGEAKNKYPIVHFRLKNGKGFIEENNTDSDIVSELLSLGIVEKDLSANQLA